MNSNDIKAIFQEGVYGARNLVNQIIDSRWNNFPFGRTPRASKTEYEDLFSIAKSIECRVIDEVERSTGFALDTDWLNSLALHTQVVKKDGPLFYLHGRLLYALLRHRIAQGDLSYVSTLETGTARGFSAVCMAKAIEDAGVDGTVVSIDVLPHFKKQLWNCIDDHDGPKSRSELLEPWSKYTKRCIFLQGDTQLLLPRVCMERIHFAFLDAQHIESSVMSEFLCVTERQKSGDIVLFDDVTRAVFPGVVEAVKRVEEIKSHNVHWLSASENRGFAFAERL